LDVEAQAPAPIVMGRHLLTMGISPGPEMGKHLDDCYEAQLDGLFTTLDEGLAYARRVLSTSH
jgi:tRNA nucleotidyltransferase (CCA-adding enzyme)